MTRQWRQRQYGGAVVRAAAAQWEDCRVPSWYFWVKFCKIQYVLKVFKLCYSHKSSHYFDGIYMWLLGFKLCFLDITTGYFYYSTARGESNDFSFVVSACSWVQVRWWKQSKLHIEESLREKKKYKNIARMDESFDPLKCHEDLPSSPGCHMEYGKMPNYHNTILITINQN